MFFCSLMDYYPVLLSFRMKILLSTLILFWTNAFIASCSDVVNVVELNTPSGWVRGYEENFNKNNMGYRFIKIPFAKPPLGSLRFQKPEPIGHWNETKGVSTEKGPFCMQPSYGEVDLGEISEDCLYLNIYVPGKISKIRKLSVMVWIHGGGFSIGGGNSYLPQKMAAEGDVIIVTINYRLGLFGFLPLHDPVANGNYGIWDQIEALRWVHYNIESFGGNSESVTIFGESAGAISVHLLSLIPQNKGLFQKTISMSGTVSSAVFGRMRDSEEEKLKLVADKTNCSLTDDRSRFLECIQAVSATDILESIPITLFTETENVSLSNGGIVPRIDGELILDNPFYIMQDSTSEGSKFYRSIDFMSGTTDAEGALLYMTLGANQKIQKKFNFNITERIPLPILCDALSPSIVELLAGNYPDLSKAICEFYTTSGNKDEQSNKITEVYGDLFFIAPQSRALNSHSLENKHTKTYQYLFSKVNPQSWSYPPSWFKGCGHADELHILFPKFLNMDKKMTKEDYTLSTQVIKYWTNFAKFSDPNCDEQQVWPEYDKEKKSYIVLDTTLSVGHDLKPDASKLINSIMDKGRQKVTHDEL